MTKFGERLKQLRLEKGLNQRELAKALNCTQPAIVKWENNTQTPNIEVAAAVAKFFGVTSDYLLGLED